MPELTHEDYKIHYDLHTKPTIYYVKIYMDELNGAQVTAPEKRKPELIEAFLKKKAAWMKETWEKHHAELYHVDRLSMEEGQKINYLGRSYQLILNEGHDYAFSFNKGKFLFTYPEDEKEDQANKKLIALAKEWLREKSEKKFSDLHSRSISPEEDAARLGKKDRDAIVLNWRLIQQPKESIKENIQKLIDEETC
ncbi:YgjP-like metallopeptidase domain-containing protein [Halobacillus halophilus]|uniref:YgjP-like metallopeptidase domain-containing protein n=1 Tax=Halobacillus halophilus TaxID=1570 RepID=UPI001CD5F22A|nr:YgjP-like metallopeptidase domain-containing protein [Halobacillus halophilus]MCA1011539.1 M48 family metallopeptidase [Halobacillus halophilus]